MVKYPFYILKLFFLFTDLSNFIYFIINISNIIYILELNSQFVKFYKLKI
jgi:hypothetical protein